MSIPINGRIAILDDKIEQVQPIIEELSKRQCPVTYYSGDIRYLPEKEAQNDVRILFLDIHLTGDEARSEKEIRGLLINYLSRIISKNNFPYLLVYWSRHEEDYKDLVEMDIFENDLKDRKPIEFLSLNKSDFFNDDNTKTDDFEERLSNIFEKLKSLVEGIPVYNYIIDWENKVHLSTDKTIEEVFNKSEDITNWENDCNFLFTKLGESYSGKTFSDKSKLEKIKSTFFTLNITLTDDLDYQTFNYQHKSPSELCYTKEVNKEAISIINRKLLTSKEIEPKKYPGTVILDKNKKNREEYLGILRKVLRNGKKEEEIIKNLTPILVVVTPLCDYVQEKDSHVRLVRGLLINSIKSKAFWNNESTYISPVFDIDGEKKMIVLNFSEFLTYKSLSSKYLEPSFRVRQQLLAELQSRLSRHINRQGILFLYE